MNWLPPGSDGDNAATHLLRSYQSWWPRPRGQPRSCRTRERAPIPRIPGPEPREAPFFNLKINGNKLKIWKSSLKSLLIKLDTSQPLAKASLCYLPQMFMFQLFFMKFISPLTLKYDVMYLLTFCSLAESRIKILKTKSRYKNEQTLKKRDKNYYWQMAFYELYIIIVSDS